MQRRTAGIVAGYQRVSPAFHFVQNGSLLLVHFDVSDPSDPMPTHLPSRASCDKRLQDAMLDY